MSGSGGESHAAALAIATVHTNDRSGADANHANARNRAGSLAESLIHEGMCIEEAT